MTSKKVRAMAVLLLVLAVLVCIAAYPMYASGLPEDEKPAVPIPAYESMIVNATWLDDGLLRIDVLDSETGNISSLAVRLDDFVIDTSKSPYILIQAVDMDGNLSGIIQVSNPFYVPFAPVDEPDSDYFSHDDSDIDSDYDTYQSPGLTPDGTGTVVDNVVTQNEIEFFTVFTEDGNEFFLVVDRQRNTDNVYLLNAVTEADLMALAHRSCNTIDGPATSVIPPIEELIPPQEVQPTPSPVPEATPEPQANLGSNTNLFLILGIAVIVGVAGYYFKIVRPKKNADFDDDEDEGEDIDEDPDDDEADEEYEFDMDTEGEEDL